MLKERKGSLKRRTRTLSLLTAPRTMISRSGKAAPCAMQQLPRRSSNQALSEYPALFLPIHILNIFFTSLFSFAKFLELLLYSPSICNLTPQLCKHTSTPPSVSGSGLPASRLNIIRHFSIASIDITISLSTIEDIFEIRVPRLQIIRGTERVTPPSTSSGIVDRSSGSESSQKRMLRKEIRNWWQGVSEHIDKIVRLLSMDR